MNNTFDLDALKQYRKNNNGYLTCAMVDWGLKNLDKEGVKAFLIETFDKASPMWRQSHYELRELK